MAVGYELAEIVVCDVHAREISYRAYGCGGEVSEAGALAGNRFAGALAGIDLLEASVGCGVFQKGRLSSGFGGIR